jgi:hypothetical protein
VSTSATGPAATARTLSSSTQSKAARTVPRSWCTTMTERPSSRSSPKRERMLASVRASTPANGLVHQHDGRLLGQRAR